MRGSRSISWLRRGVVLAVVAAVATAAASVLGLLEAPVWARLVVVLVIAGIAVVIALEKERGDRRGRKETEEQHRRAEEAAESKWQIAVQDCLLWPPPKIGDVNPYKELGVAPSQLAEHFTAAGQLVAPYVSRDIDRAAAKRLQSQGFLLLIGAPASGVTRTAYQLALTVPTSPALIVPLRPDGLTAALSGLDVLSRLSSRTPLMLWLDRVDKLSEAGLTAAQVRRCGEHSPGLRVIATISSNRYEVWASENPSLSNAFGDPVNLNRVPSEAELDRAEAVYPGVDFSEGIAAAMTVNAALLKRLHGGNHSCGSERAGEDCALARAIVEITSEWVSTDVGRPLPVAELHVLAQQRLNPRQKIEATHLEEALKWATSPVLGETSLLSVSAVPGPLTVTAHVTIVDISRAEGGGPADTVWVAALEAASFADDSEGVGRIGFRAHTTGHMRAAARAWAMVTTIEEPAAEWLRRAAVASRDRGDPTAEIALRERILELTEAAYESDSRMVMIALAEMGVARTQLGQSAKACELYERALHIAEREYGAEHGIVGLITAQLANAWRNLGKPALACELLERALHIAERECGSDRPAVASCLTNLGIAQCDMGNLDHGRKLLEQALHILESTFGPDHPNVGSCLTNLGIVWSDLGQPSKARALLERALHIDEQCFGPNHPQIAVNAGNLGNVYRELGLSAKAREHYERALRIDERAFGPNHPEIAGILTNLGTLWCELGQPTKARELLERALDIAEREFGPDHPKVAAMLSNLGNLWRVLGSPTKARELLERALRIEERAFGGEHPATAITLMNLAKAWHEMGQLEKAHELFERALRIVHVHFEPGNPKVRSVIRAAHEIDPDVLITDNGSVARWSH